MKFTIVTPSFNSERFIAETIQSVIGQFGDFYIEYIIMDGCSTDRTPEIVREFQERLNSDRFKVNCAGIELKYFSMKDDGMYDAINKGFRMGTGEIFAWLNSDDIYLPGALSIIQKCFEKYDSVQWLKGKSTYINEMSAIYQPCRHFVYARTWLASGYYGPVAPFVEQESVFWRANLWPRVGDEIAQYKLAGDFKAWILMSRECRLYCLDAFVSCFRRVEGQKSQDIQAYWREVREEVPNSRWRIVLIKVMKRVARYLPSRVTRYILKSVLGYEGFSVILPDAGDVSNLNLYDDVIPKWNRTFNYL